MLRHGSAGQVSRAVGRANVGTLNGASGSIMLDVGCNIEHNRCSHCAAMQCCLSVRAFVGPKP